MKSPNIADFPNSLAGLSPCLREPLPEGCLALHSTNRHMLCDWHFNRLPESAQNYLDYVLEDDLKRRAFGSTRYREALRSAYSVLDALAGHVIDFEREYEDALVEKACETTCPDCLFRGWKTLVNRLDVILLWCPNCDKAATLTHIAQRRLPWLMI